ncbi:hypothetical protein L484_013502 [Morus notabilis]|uniref:Uncharacterized protein n=1 Tax=Morus notabilis TaxID=981085 RepID=W9QQ61_9ROSA|nr:hypothetical protein L484_013502 [Morus notabilis]
MNFLILDSGIYSNYKKLVAADSKPSFLSSEEAAKMHDVMIHYIIQYVLDGDSTTFERPANFR